MLGIFKSAAATYIGMFVLTFGISYGAMHLSERQVYSEDCNISANQQIIKIKLAIREN